MLQGRVAMGATTWVPEGEIDISVDATYHATTGFTITSTSGSVDFVSTQSSAISTTSGSIHGTAAEFVDFSSTANMRIQTANRAAAGASGVRCCLKVSHARNAVVELCSCGSGPMQAKLSWEAEAQATALLGRCL